MGFHPSELHGLTEMDCLLKKIQLCSSQEREPHTSGIARDSVNNERFLIFNFGMDHPFKWKINLI